MDKNGISHDTSTWKQSAGFFKNTDACRFGGQLAEHFGNHHFDLPPCQGMFSLTWFTTTMMVGKPLMTIHP